MFRHTRCKPQPTGLIGVAIALLFASALVATASARSLYVADGLSASPGSVNQFRLGSSGKPSALDPASVATGDGPQHLAFTPDGRFVYATAATAGRLFQYRANRAGRLQPLDPPSVPAGPGAHGVVVSPDGRSAYVGNQETGSVSQYDIAGDGTLTPKSPAEIISGSGESGVAMAPNGRSAYVTNLSDNSVGQFSVDRQTGNLSSKPRAKVVVPAAPSGLAVHPNGKTLYVATLSGNVFQFKIRPNGGLRRMSPAKAKTGLGASGVAITADGSHLYTPNSGSDSVSQFRIDRRSGALTPLRPAKVPVGDRPEGAAVSPDGRSLYVSIAGQDGARWLTIKRSGKLSGNDRTVIPTAAGPHGLVVSPDQSPVASIDPSGSAVAGRKLVLTARSSYDPDGRIAKYVWRFGDGGSATTSRPRVSHRFRRLGRVAVHLRVVDREGCSYRMAYTGQSALCSGGPSRTSTRIRVRRSGSQTKSRPSGSLTQLRGPAGCVVDSSQGARGCDEARALKTPGPFKGSHGIAISPDGRSAYVASSGSDAIAVFARDKQTGALRQAEGTTGCVAEAGADGCAAAIGLEGPASVAVSHDGTTVYAASAASDAVTAFARNPHTGALTQLSGDSGCVSSQPIDGCAAGRGLDGADTVAVSPDGLNVYVGAFDGGAIATFNRSAQGALSQPTDETGCLAATATPGCATALGIKAVESVVVSPDGGKVFAAGALSSAVTSFERGSSGALTPSPSGCVSIPAPTGCIFGRSILGVNDVASSPGSDSLYAVTAISSSLASFAIGGEGITQSAGRAHCLVFDPAPRCAVGNGMSVPESVTVSPDGRNVYAASFESWSVVSLARGKKGAFRQLPGRSGCVSPASDGCATGRRLSGAAGIAISPDGRFVYATSSIADAVTVFRRATS